MLSKLWADLQTFAFMPLQCWAQVVRPQERPYLSLNADCNVDVKLICYSATSSAPLIPNSANVRVLLPMWNLNWSSCSCGSNGRKARVRPAPRAFWRSRWWAAPSCTPRRTEMVTSTALKRWTRYIALGTWIVNTNIMNTSRRRSSLVFDKNVLDSVQNCILFQPAFISTLVYNSRCACVSTSCVVCACVWLQILDGLAAAGAK